MGARLDYGFGWEQKILTFPKQHSAVTEWKSGRGQREVERSPKRGESPWHWTQDPGQTWGQCVAQLVSMSYSN